jgi:hypothetical protein
MLIVDPRIAWAKLAAMAEGPRLATAYGEIASGKNPFSERAGVSAVVQSRPSFPDGPARRSARWLPTRSSKRRAKDPYIERS